MTSRGLSKHLLPHIRRNPLLIKAFASFMLVVLSFMAVGSPRGVGASLPSVNITVNTSQSLGPINKNVLGVNQLGSPNELTTMKKMGLQWVRIDASLEAETNGVPAYDCQSGIWNPSILASRLALTKQAGANPEVIVDYSPSCLATKPSQYASPGYSPPDIGANKAKWISLITQLATYAIQNGVRDFEVWNEPDWLFWNGGLPAYLQLYSDTSQALEAVAKKDGVTIQVGVPALANVTNSMDMNWLDTFLAYVAKNNLPLDFISWHDYSNDPNSGPQGGLPPLCNFQFSTAKSLNGTPCYYTTTFSTSSYRDEVNQVKNELKNYPKLHPLLWIDEWNMDAEFDPRENSSFDAAFALSALEAATQAGVDRMCWYNVWDGDKNSAFGLLNNSFQPKPTYYAFFFWSQMNGNIVLSNINNPNSLSFPNDPFGTGGGVGEIAAKDSSGTIRILIYNFVPYDSQNNFGQRIGGPYVVSVNLNVASDKSLAQSASINQILPSSSNKFLAISNSNVIQKSPSNYSLSLSLNEDQVDLVTLSPENSPSPTHSLKGIYLIVTGACAAILLILMLIIRVMKGVSRQNR
ncbi:MAG: hypothetical protein HKL80_03145 [Acidimicrobiales bacterium]|nr:hypothetical protein [Acidimicrobiales bacterium]